MRYNVIEAVKELMEVKEINRNQMSKKLEVSRAAITDKLSKDDIGVKKLNEMLKFLGYKMVLVPDDTVMKKDWYEIK